MLNKVNEVGNLYSRANSEVFYLMNQWMEQDEVLAQNFRDSLQGGGPLADNLRRLFSPEKDCLLLRRWFIVMIAMECP
ncbi:TPA: hypothetical protein TXL52_001226 [Streptococcus suis]|nr:hypothetical protein [Streptococcus suis]WNF84418.1 hypothetical protein RJW52_00380 [Streptococcus suis]HEL1613158.1 hypothetical protein [Streptococcus suis]